MALGVRAGVDPAHHAGESRRWVRLTRACNQRCVFCLDRGNQDGVPVPLAEVRERLRAGRAAGARRAVLSGGEPTLSPWFLETVAAARELGYGHVQVVTNGRRFCYPAFARAAREAGLSEATVSVHGPDAGTHDALTRAPGSFVQAMAGLRNALAAGLVVSADAVVNRRNLPVLRETLEALGALGVREFDLLAVTPYGDAWRNWDELAIDPGEPAQRRAMARALEVSRRPGWTVWTNRMDPRWLEGFERLLQPPERMAEEAAGRARDLEPLLTEGREPSCSGPRCAACWLSGLCEDARLLRRDGVLRGAPRPACAGGGPGAELRREGAGWEDLARFHALERRAAKAARCRGCAVAGACAGLPLKAWREHG